MSDRSPYAVELHDDLLLLRSLRIKQGYTLESFAEKLDMSAQQLQRLETGARRISLNVMLKAANVLDVPIGQLVRNGDGITPEEREMLDYLRNHPRDRRVIMATLDGLRELVNES